MCVLWVKVFPVAASFVDFCIVGCDVTEEPEVEKVVGIRPDRSRASLLSKLALMSPVASMDVFADLVRFSMELEV